MKPRKWIKKEIKALHSEDDYAKIVDILMNWRDKNPFSHHLLYTLIFLRQIADPTIASIVYRAGAGRIIKATAVRADKTMHFVGGWFRHGPESEKGKASIEKLNTIHKQFSITNEQYLYTLSTFLLVPDRFRRNLGLLPRSQHENNAMTKFRKVVGSMMNISEIPDSWMAFNKFYDDYEKTHFQYSDDGMKCAKVLVDEFVNPWFKTKPKVGRRSLLANFDSSLRTVLPFNYPNKITSFLLRRYVGWGGALKKLNKADASKPLYVEDMFNPKRPENTGAPR